MATPKLTAEQIERARELRLSGMSYQRIGLAFGVVTNTISRALNPEVRLRQNEKGKAAYRRDFVKKQEWAKAYAKTPRGLANARLSKSRIVAAQNGYRAVNLSLDELTGILTSATRCEICGVPQQECARGLDMDHCHSTGEFRGMLCSRCNRVLGYVDDSPELLDQMSAYLGARKAA